MIIFALYNFKGGVGKTTAAVNLAYLSGQDGFETLLWDLDAQSAATFYLGEEDSVNGSMKGLIQKKGELSHFIKPTKFKNLSFIPGHINNRNLDIDLSRTERQKRKFQQIKAALKSEFKYVFLDCPPSMSQTAEQVFKMAHFILIPLIPSPLSERTFGQILNHFEEKGFDIRKLVPFFSMTDNRKALHRETIKTFRETYPKVLRSEIPTASEIEKMGIHRAPVSEFDFASKGSTAYRTLWQELKWFKKLTSRRLLSLRKR